MSAIDYLINYHPELEYGDDRVNESVLSTLYPYETVSLLTLQQLAEAWPEEYRAKTPASEDGEDAGDDDQSQEPPTLFELAFAPALEQLLLNGDVDTRILGVIMATPKKTSKIKEVLRSRQSPIPDSGLPLLSRLLECELHGQHQKSADISGLSLSCRQILDIVTQHPDLDTLNISSNSQVTIDVVEKLLVTLPKLRRLKALYTGITDEDAIRFLERRPDLFRNLEAFIHPAFLNTPSHAQFKGAYLHISDSYYDYGTYAVSLPFFTTGQII